MTSNTFLELFVLNSGKYRRNSLETVKILFSLLEIYRIVKLSSALVKQINTSIWMLTP